MTDADLYALSGLDAPTILALLGDILADSGMLVHENGMFSFPGELRVVDLPTLTSDERRRLWGWLSANAAGLPQDTARIGRYLVNLARAHALNRAYEEEQRVD